MGIREYDSTECTECGMFNVGDVYCEDCIKELFEKLKKEIIESENSKYLQTSSKDGVLDIIDRIASPFHGKVKA